MDQVKNGFNLLFNTESHQLGHDNFWIDYDSNKLKSKGFIFVERIDLSSYFNFEFIFDEFSTTMLYVVLMVSFFVHLFSIYYIKSDPNYNKFFFYI